MFWRSFKLNWSYALGELAIVTAGILIALAVDDWNRDRLERAQERDVIARLIADLERDQAGLELQLGSMDLKEASLHRVKNALASGVPGDAALFCADIVIGANFGWSQILARRVTYDELLESGHLSVLHDADIRALIATYYGTFQGASTRMDARETRYPSLTYELIPRAEMKDGVAEGRLDPTLGADEIDAIVAAVMRSQLKDTVVAEINLARFIRGVTKGVHAQGTTLIDRLRKYRQEIE